MLQRSPFQVIAAFLGTAFMILACTFSALASDPCAVQHPLDPPNMELPGQCINCGMARPMWARTWITFHNSNGQSAVCSLHCLADIALKSGEEPQDVQVALYLEPTKMVPANQAFFVVGSKAKGTMTMTSKLAFQSKGDAENFAKSCGGKVMSFAEAFALAKEGVAKENKVINERRIKTGKIVEPVHGKDRCAVCQMYPARYTRDKCQLQTKQGQVYQFCSTQCMFKFLADSSKYAKTNVTPFLVWVIDYPTETWFGAKAAYYVVESKSQGPMGPEAFAFANLKDAKDFAAEHGGQVLTFKEVSVDKIMAEQ